MEDGKLVFTPTDNGWLEVSPLRIQIDEDTTITVTDLAFQEIPPGITHIDNISFLLSQRLIKKEPSQFLMKIRCVSVVLTDDTIYAIYIHVDRHLCQELSLPYVVGVTIETSYTVTNEPELYQHIPGDELILVMQLKPNLSSE